MRPDPIEVIGRLKKRQSRLAILRLPYESIWHDISDFIQTRRSSWDIQNAGLELPELYNTTALTAHRIQTAGFTNYMTSRTQPWMKLTIADRYVRSLPGVSAWLDDASAALLDFLADSNFYDQHDRLASDAGGIGTGTMFADRNPAERKVYFSTRHPKEIWISDGEYGLANTVYRNFLMSYANIGRRFKKLPEAVQRKVNDEPDSFCLMLHAVEPRDIFDPESNYSLDYEFASYYVSLTDSELIDEGGFKEFPYIVWRWDRNTDEIYGRSPAMDAFSDVMRLNQISKTQLELAQKIADPPMQIPETLKDSVRLGPGGRNYMDEREEITPIALGSNYPITIEIERSVEKIINDHFNVDFFMTLAKIDREMTAREVFERKGEISAVLGSVIGSHKTEVADPVLSRAFEMASGWGKIPVPPLVLRDANVKLDIEYTGYLAQIQRKYYSTSGISSALEIMLPLMQAFPDSIDNVDTDELLRESADAFGLPAKILRDKPLMEMIRQQRAQAMQAAQAQNAQLQLAQKVDPNKAAEPGSLADRVLGGQQ